MNKYEVYDMIDKVGPFYTVICGVSTLCRDCEFFKRYDDSPFKCPYNLMSKDMFDRTHMENWNEVQKLVQTLFEEGVA